MTPKGVHGPAGDASHICSQLCTRTTSTAASTWPPSRPRPARASTSAPPSGPRSAACSRFVISLPVLPLFAVLEPCRGMGCPAEWLGRCGAMEDACRMVLVADRLRAVGTMAGLHFAHRRVSGALASLGVKLIISFHLPLLY